MDTQKISAMTTGGAKLHRVKQGLVDFVQVGTTFEAIEAKAQALIKAEGAVPSFSTVPGYDWATCLMRNDEMCHGIPKGKRVENGDSLKIDVGLIEQGYHLDTTTTILVGEATTAKQEFLRVGQQTLAKAITKARVGNTVYDISRALQKGVETHGCGAVYQLTGHGIGEKLHDWPNIPCVADKSDKRIKLQAGMTLAIEIMYSAGDPELVLAKDGWTYQTKDGSEAGMFEETVLITDAGPQILT